MGLVEATRIDQVTCLLVTCGKNDALRTTKMHNRHYPLVCKHFIFSQQTEFFSLLSFIHKLMGEREGEEEEESEKEKTRKREKQERGGG